MLFRTEGKGMEGNGREGEERIEIAVDRLLEGGHRGLRAVVSLVA